MTPVRFGYNVDKCIGCRYCMVACPFEIPAYEYFDPITPKVMKCTFCYDRISKQGGLPGCATICPTEALTFGKGRPWSKWQNNGLSRILGNISIIYTEKKKQEGPLGCIFPPYPLKRSICPHYLTNPCPNCLKPSSTLCSATCGHPLPFSGFRPFYGYYQQKQAEKETGKGGNDA